MLKAAGNLFMSMPIRQLPVVQNWDCHSCAQCCREYDVAVSAEERERIEAQAWSVDPEIGKTPLFVRMGRFWSGSYRLNHRKDRGCIFLTKDNRCKIHEKFGHEAKPLACRLFPFVLVPVGDHWRISIRYACPSAADNLGGPFSDRAAELTNLAAEYEQLLNISQKALAPPMLRGGQMVDWPDVLRFCDVLQQLMSNRQDSVERRWRKCLSLAKLCRKARFDVVKGNRLDEFLDVLRGSLDDEVTADPTTIAEPSWVGRILFRQLVAMYGRVDRGELRGLASRGRVALFLAGCRFATGAGKVPKINARIQDVTFADVEQPLGELSPDADEILERFFLVKLNALQFFGPINAGASLWDGLDALALTLPIALWLARAVRLDSTERAITHALGIVDDHFGFNPVLKSRRYRLVHRILAGRDEIPNLIAWHGR